MASLPNAFLPANREKQFEVMRLLARKIHLEDPLDYINNERDFIRFRGSGELFRWLLTESDSSWRQLGLECRVELASKLRAVASQPDLESLVRGVLEGRKVDKAIFMMRGSANETLLGCAAWTLGELCARTQWVGYSDSYHLENGSRISKLLSLIGELIIGGSE